MSRRKQHHLAGSSFSPLCNICMVSNLFAMQWEPRETISHGGIWTIHAALLSFYNHAATPGAICLLLRPCRQCTHMHAISRVQMQVYWTLEPKSFCHYQPKKAAISTFYLVSNHHPKLIALNFIHETNFFFFGCHQARLRILAFYWTVNWIRLRGSALIAPLLEL